jgi:dCMP deaminase
MRRVTNRLENPDEYFLFLAHVLAIRATCSRRRVGCLLVNAKRHVKATGYNGVGSGKAHCIQAPCLGAEAPSGTLLEYCMSTHAEINALDQLEAEVTGELTAYITVTPCFPCADELIKDGRVKTIVTSSIYTDNSGLDSLKSNGIIHRGVEIDGDQIFNEFLRGIK